MSSYVRNSVLILAERIIRLALAIVGSILVARYLGPEQYGAVGLFSSIYAILKVASSLGVDQITVRRLSVGDQPNRVAAHHVLLKGLSGTLVSVLFFIYICATENEVGAYAVPLIFTTVLQGLDYFELFGQARGASRVQVLAAAGSAIFCFLLKVILVYFQAPLSYFLFALALDGLILLSAYYVFGRKEFSTASLNLFSPSYVRGYISESWPLLASAGAVIVYMKVDIIMVYHISGAIEAGNYTIAVRLSELPYVIPTMLLAGLFPVLVRSYGSSVSEYIKSSERVVAVLLYLSIIISAVVFFVGPYAVLMLYGQSYELASKIVAIHGLSCIPVFVGVAFRRMAVVEGAQRITLVVTLIGCMLNVILNCLLIPQYGGVGAAFATLLARLLSSLLLYGVFSPTRHYLRVLVRAVSLERLSSALKG